MERMTPKDAAILSLEDDVTAAHGMTLAVFDGPEPDFDDVLDRVADRVRLLPRYRQRMLEVPFEMERPVWVDDPNFSIDFHVRHTALPSRKSRDPLNAFVSRMLSQRLDRGKPLWELWMVSNLPDGRWAIVSKVHYSIIDGVSGSDIIGMLADDIEANATIGQRMPRPLPSQTALVTGAVTDVLFNPMEALFVARTAAERPTRLARRIRSSLMATADPNGLGRSKGPHRKWQSAAVPLADLREIKKKQECTTTDVILAGVAGGIRSYLEENGKPLPTAVQVMVPLAVGAASGGLSGQVTTLQCALPIAEPDPVVRLQSINEQTGPGAERTGAIAGRVLRRQEHFSAPSILAQGVRSTMLETRDRPDIDSIAIKTVNILGYPMVEAYPVVPLAGGVQIAMAAMSLADTVYFGISSDFDSTKGLRHASSGVRAAIEELLDA